MAKSFDRRSFLGATAGLAGLGLMTPAAFPLVAGHARPRTQPGPRPVPPNSRIGIALIGCGKRMFEMLGPLADHPDLQIRGVCDVDATRRTEAGNRIVERMRRRALDAGGALADAGIAEFVDHRELIAMPGVDAVVICTPDHWHADQVLDAAAAGKDIYCEKPLTQCLHECRAMIEAVRKHGVVFQTGSQQRTEYDHRFVRACELVRAGKIGKVLSVHVGVADPPVACDLAGEAPEPGLEWDRWLGPAPWREYNAELSPRGVHNHYPTWRNYKEYCGGYLADMGAHHFDIAQWGLGLDASGPARVEPPEMGDRAGIGGQLPMRGATLVTPDGVRIIHGGPSGTTFVGTEGIIAVDRGRIASVPGNILDAELGEDERLPRKASHIQDWVDCMRSRERCICDVEIGARSAALCHLMNLAYEHRRTLHWDAAAWRFRGDDAANAWLERDRREGYALPAW
ncbi:MAG: Gfo/Idh/MocA family oxidoreductase [Phycisphaerales bacterium]